MLRLISVLLLPILALMAQPVSAAEQLNVHHFLSPESTTHKLLILPWTQQIEKQTQGKLTFRIYPSMTLGGKAPELYSQVKDGIVDIAWTLIGYTPGLFPRTEVFELPGIHQGSALQTTLAANSIFEAIQEDYKDVHVVLLHAHSGNALHMVKSPIRSFAALKHRRLRTPSRTGGWMISAWNAVPVSMPVPRLPLALTKKNVDGALLPFEVMPALGVQDLTPFSIEGPNGYRFGTSIFVLLMNKKRYASLDSDLRSIFDRISGTDFQVRAGELWEEQEALAKQSQLDSGGEIIVLSEDEIASIRKNDSAVWKRWTKAVSRKGVDAHNLLKLASDAIDSY